MSDTQDVLGTDEVCRRALEVWGEKAQRQMVMEELGELTAAINQYHRGRISDAQLAGEIADVELCLRQLEMMVGESVVEDARLRKRDALAHKLADIKGERADD